VAIYRRGRVLWVSFYVPKEMAARLGCARVIRESVGSSDKREATALLSKRKREVKDGTWRPSALGGTGLSLATYAERWTADRKAMGLRSARRDKDMLAPLLETIGSRRIDEIKRSDVLQAVKAMRLATGKRGKAKGEAYAPMTIHRAYGVLRALFSDALREEIVQVNPCTLQTRAGELPPREDADRRWRQKAVFARGEVVALCSDERLPEVRRMLYGLTFFCGLRLGEAVARSWADYDTAAEPLGRLDVATQHDGRALKTDNPREVPVHPELARMLAAWHDRYELHYGDKPEGDALIVRNRNGGRFLPNVTLRNLLQDLRTLGLRRRRFHDLRRTLVTLARADGARGELLRWVTHGPTKGIVDVYTSPTWASLCEQIACLKVALPRPPEATPPTRPGMKRGAQSRAQSDELPN
jgi:integrase